MIVHWAHQKFGRQCLRGGHRPRPINHEFKLHACILARRRDVTLLHALVPTSRWMWIRSAGGPICGARDFGTDPRSFRSVNN